MEAMVRNTELSTVRQRLKNQERQLLYRRIRSNKNFLIGSISILFLVCVAALGPLFLNYTPYVLDIANRLQGPSPSHLLGTDEFGRDLLTRMVYGTRITLIVGFSVAGIATIMGLIIGLYASYYKKLDSILMRICDGLMSIPSILLAIALMAALGPTIFNVILALGIVFTPYIARVVRSVALVVREQTYIEAMKAQGASALRIIWGHIMPNTISPLIVQTTVIFANAIIVEAALSFLGVGVPAPDPSLGNILYDGKVVIYKAWWMTLFPGIMIVLSVLGLNFLGDGLRDLVDPHTTNVK